MLQRSVMEKDDCKSENSEKSIFYILAFIFGFFLFIFLKQRKASNRGQEEAVVDSGEILNSITERQRIILNAIRRKKIVSPSEIYALVPNISTRTVRRDLDALIKEGLVTQEGTTKSTMYRYTE